MENEMIQFNIVQLIVWLILGALAGATVSFITGRHRSLLRNMVLGLVGALVGGFLFQALRISIAPSLSANISVDDFIAAVVGAFLVLGFLILIRRL
jgi:uncharacterized membrane protein YeaQ/YmgE (transglycosylase-associated protein family)